MKRSALVPMLGMRTAGRVRRPDRHARAVGGRCRPRGEGHRQSQVQPQGHRLHPDVRRLGHVRVQDHGVGEHGRGVRDHRGRRADQRGLSEPRGNVAPGQAYTTSASQTFAAPRTENGQVTGSVTFDFGAVADPTAASVCPNAKWEVVNVRKSILSYDFFAVVNPDSPSAITIRP
jgi:hypothetical protein